MQANSDDSHENFQLLQLPGPALDGVLQQLDQCSLACAAAACSKLRDATPAHIHRMAVRCCSQSLMDSFVAWLGQHSTSVINLTECSIDSGWHWSDPQWYDKLQHPLNWVTLSSLPCPQLRKLHLSTIKVQLAATDSHPGVLQGCTGLTALDLQNCIVEDICTAPTAVAAALPELCSLRLTVYAGADDHAFVQPDKFQLADLQACTKLTELCLAHKASGAHQEQLTQLSALTTLKQLGLPHLPYIQDDAAGIITVPSELLKLTCLHMGTLTGGVVAEELKHLSALTALQELSIAVRGFRGEADRVLSLCFQQLPQLTSIQVRHGEVVGGPPDFMLAIPNSIARCAHLTALERLSLTRCWVPPEALKTLTQLRSLAVVEPKSQSPWTMRPPYEELLAAAAQLRLLTELRLNAEVQTAYGITPLWVPTGACVALLGCRNLCSLQIGWRVHSEGEREGCHLYHVPLLYPRLRQINLAHDCNSHPMPIGATQLQHLCSCCPFVESLGFNLCHDAPATAYLPLLQLSALTALDIWSADAAVLETVVQLSGLKQLALHRVPALTDPTLSQLTVLTALEDLTVYSLPEGYLGPPYQVHLVNKACWHNPPDVWMQLLRHLSPDAAQPSSSAEAQLGSRTAAAPAGFSPAQPAAATLAEQLAASSLTD